MILYSPLFCLAASEALEKLEREYWRDMAAHYELNGMRLLASMENDAALIAREAHIARGADRIVCEQLEEIAAQCRRDRAEAASKWSKFAREDWARLGDLFRRFAEVPGIWGPAPDLPNFWKVDSCENPMRMRVLLRRNWEGSDHAEADAELARMKRNAKHAEARYEYEASKRKKREAAAAAIRAAEEAEACALAIATSKAAEGSSTTREEEEEGEEEGEGEEGATPTPVVSLERLAEVIDMALECANAATIAASEADGAATVSASDAAQSAYSDEDTLLADLGRGAAGASGLAVAFASEPVQLITPRYIVHGRLELTPRCLSFFGERIEAQNEEDDPNALLKAEVKWEPDAVADGPRGCAGEFFLLFRVIGLYD